MDKSNATPKADRRHVRYFDTLGAIAKNPNNNSRMLFFGIPKGTFYKKSPLAGFGAKAPSSWPDSCLLSAEQRLAKGLCP